MAYVFENQNLASTKAKINRGTGYDDVNHTINFINGNQTSADSIMSGLTDLYGIVGWQPYDVVRTVKQNVNDDT